MIQFDSETSESTASDVNGHERPPVEDHLGASRLILINKTGAPQGKLDEQLRRLGFLILHVQQGPDAMNEINLLAGSAEAVILDWRCEGAKDGPFAEALAHASALAGLPVLTLAAATRAEDMQLASEAGLADHLPTPCQLADLKAMLGEVVKKRRQRPEMSNLSLEDAVMLLESCKFRFRTPDDVEKLVPLIARIFPKPTRAAAGIAELMLNAIEHGNLEIGQERKANWIARGVYRAELAKRLNTPPYSTRWGEVIINRRADGIMIVIMDQGCGFCWQDLIKNPAAENGATAVAAGNGIAKAKSECFDDIRFNLQGNQVTGFVSTDNHVW
ncbi:MULTISPECIES: hypothetical protein [Rhodomicrobium]|uniref:hypothetical protein n=1 Tax=Rhodomicrobium TaxID=1068 RepID=UPI000B4B1ABD|nr:MULTISPECIES: hypothetical protein [Rhodomicrobium]